MSSRKYTIRAARAEDADAVTAMWRQMAGEHQSYDAQRWAFAADADQRQREHFLETLRDDQKGVVLVAADPAGQVVGYLLAGISEPPPVFRTRRRGQIWDLFVAPAHRRKGLARRLMVSAVEALKARGAEDLVLRVSAENVAGIKFYRKMGMNLVVHEMHRML